MLRSGQQTPQVTILKNLFRRTNFIPSEMRSHLWVLMEECHALIYTV